MSTRHRRSQERAYRKPYERQTFEPLPVETDKHFKEEPATSEAAGELVSTNQAVNLTCTLAALSALFALFLYFNDHRSRAVRRMSVQSMGLMAAYALMAAALIACQAFFGLIPIVGVVMGLILWITLVALSLGVVYLKVQMMKQGYQGYAYQLPVIGRWLRRFE